MLCRQQQLATEDRQAGKQLDNQCGVCMYVWRRSAAWLIGKSDGKKLLVQKNNNNNNKNYIQFINKKKRQTAESEICRSFADTLLLLLWWLRLLSELLIGTQNWLVQKQKQTAVETQLFHKKCGKKLVWMYVIKKRRYLWEVNVKVLDAW